MTVSAPFNRTWGMTATGTAAVLHLAVVWALLLMPRANVTPPLVAGGFEIVDLSAFGVVAQPEPAPLPEPEPEPKPEPKVIDKAESAPLPVSKLKPVVQPKPMVQPKPELRPLHRIQPKPTPKQQTISAPGSQNAFVPPSERAAYLRNPKPSYPAMAQRSGTQGVVLLFVKVSAQGAPLVVTVKKSSGFMLLDKAALKAVRGWRFAPATRGGRAVAAGVEVPIRFILNDA